jgi:hypothetical protein
MRSHQDLIVTEEDLSPRVRYEAASKTRPDLAKLQRDRGNWRGPPVSAADFTAAIIEGRLDAGDGTG